MKKLLALVVALIIAAMSVMPVCALEYGSEWANYTPSTSKSFKDVPEDHWAKGNIDRAVAKGWFSGYPDGTFHPDASITRAEAMTVFVNFLGVQVLPVTETSYYDVRADEWYAPQIEAGKKLFPPIVAYNGNSPFQPEMPMTREDTIYALVIALKHDDRLVNANQAILNMFKDKNSISHNIKSHVSVAVELGLVAGHADGTIGAQDPLTRAEFATLLARASTVGFGKGGGIESIPDPEPVIPDPIVPTPVEPTPVVPEPIQDTIVAGIVTDSNNAPIAGASITSNDGNTATTDAEGKYSFKTTSTRVTVTAEKEGYNGGRVTLNVTAETTNNAPTIVLTVDEPEPVPDTFVSGRVVDENNNPMQGVSIDSDDSNTVTTDAEGMYKFKTTAENVTIKAKKEGFVDAQITLAVLPGITNYAETIKLVEDAQGKIAGKVYDAVVQGGVVAGATINFRKNGNTKTGPIVATVVSDDNGNYSVELPTGTYTAEAIKETYSTAYVTVVSQEVDAQQDITLAPYRDGTAFILTWGEHPSDLDSHFTGPKADGSRFHVFYAQRSGKDGSEEVANLDVDDVTSYGPETVTLVEQVDGVYRYSVHDYSNRGSRNSKAMSLSGAKVTVYVDGEYKATYNVPVNQGGTVWTVFELNGDTITPVNTMSYQSSPGAVSGEATRSNDDVYVISSSLQEK